jgi:hypothetical protein
MASPRIALIVALVAVNLVSAVVFLSRRVPLVANGASFIVSLTDGYYSSADDDMVKSLTGRE